MFLLAATSLYADVALTDKSSTVRLIAETENATPLTPAEKQAIRDANAAKRAAKHAKHAHSLTPVSENLMPLTPAQKQAILDANAAKRAAKRARQQHSTMMRRSSDSLHPRADATGSIQLIDAEGLKYFINTNITFSTTSSASGAVSEASYTHAVAATTLSGGTTPYALNDAYDGANTLCVSFTNTLTNCATGNPNFVFYNKLGPATFDTTVPASPECTNRMVDFPVTTLTDPADNTHAIQVQRKVYVPPNDNYIRWENTFKNTSSTPITFSPVIANNLGSDSNTQITGSSSGDLVATTADTWVGSFQAYSGTNSTDPRLGHVFQGPQATTPLAAITFVNGSDKPFWAYTLTLAPGQTKTILNFETGAPSKALANSRAAALSTLPDTARQCLSTTQLSQVSNFVTVTPPDIPTIDPRGLVLLALAIGAVAVHMLNRN